MKIIFCLLCLFSINSSLRAQKLTGIIIKDSLIKEMHFKTSDTLPIDKKIIRLCKNWKLTKHDMLNIFALSKKITSEEKGGAYYDVPCFYKATVMLNDSTYTMEINAASYIVLY